MAAFLSDEFLENIECCWESGVDSGCCQVGQAQGCQVAQPAMKLVNFAARNIITVAGDSSQQSHLLTLSTSL